MSGGARVPRGERSVSGHTSGGASRLSCFAPCAKGLEYLMVDELRSFGIDSAREALAGVHFEGSQRDALQAVMGSRLASRILIRVAEFPCGDESTLYDGIAALPWEEHLDATGSLWIDAHGRSGALIHTQFVAQRAKDAIVDRLRRADGVRPGVERDDPDLRIDLALRKGKAVVSIDLAGPLHRRGWRSQQGEAPLKETLAAAVLLRGGWPAMAGEGAALLDPMCGAGTLVIEAALMAADVAPGLQRHRSAPPTRWRGFDAAAWAEVVQGAELRAAAGKAAMQCRFIGHDIDPRALRLAESNARDAGVADWCTWSAADVRHMPAPKAQRGLVVCNPPYDARLAADPALYRALGDRLQAATPGWRASILCGDAELARATGLRAQKTYSLFNGALACTLIVVDPMRDAARTAPAARAGQPLSEGAQMVANRLRKNLDRLARWRKREAVSCFRVYDADLPEYAAAIDVYVGRAAPHATYLHVQEYQAPRSVDEEAARRRFGELVRAAADVFELPRDHIALKTRRRGKGGSKYGVLDRRGEQLVVDEDGLALEVNLFDYLDTGLFLDHRPARRMLRAAASGKRFLNLFCYTASATVHAAAGGASSTTSVDLSSTYLEWAGRNLALNGFSGAKHRLVQADAMRWLAAERGQYDLIFCDPPTFSNSARADDFDIQQAHAELIDRCMARLSADGLLLFSTNAQRFRLDEALGERYDVSELGRQALPPDFERHPKIHRVFSIIHPS